jgi:hypothetical protein
MRPSLSTRLGAAIGAGIVLGSLGLVAPAPAAAPPDWRTTPTTVENPRARAPKVLDLRWAGHPRFDRVVIDVSGRTPGYAVRYVDRLSRDGSGHVVRMRGRHKLEIYLRPAYAHDRSGDSTYTGPRRRLVDLPGLRGVAFLGDFEGQVSFGFGLRTKPYRVFTLGNPSRVVLDFKHRG